MFSSIILSVVCLSILNPLGASSSPVQADVGSAASLTDQYIVVFKNGVSQSAIEAHKHNVTQIHHEHYKRAGTTTIGISNSFSIHGFNAYAGVFDHGTLESILNSSLVKYVELNKVITTSSFATEKWNLQRVSQFTTLTVPPPYAYINYPPSPGLGVVVYVLDTGIDITHPDFGGRATWGTNFAGDGADYDGFGHGTHCAGIIGSNTFGVANAVSLVAVKVLNINGSGNTATVMAGIQWVVNNMVAGSSPIISMSLGGQFSSALNDAVASAVAGGITIAVAAGNDGQNANNTSPASAPGALCVGATDLKDTQASFSNFGSTVDLFAPGVNVWSTWPNYEMAELSGTSMACPHVAGVAAILIAQNGGAMTPGAVRSKILALGSFGTVVDAGPGSPNQIVYNQFRHTISSSSTPSAIQYNPSTTSSLTSKISTSFLKSTSSLTKTTSPSTTKNTTPSSILRITTTIQSTRQAATLKSLWTTSLSSIKKSTTLTSTTTSLASFKEITTWTSTSTTSISSKKSITSFLTTPTSSSKSTTSTAKTISVIISTSNPKAPTINLSKVTTTPLFARKCSVRNFKRGQSH